MLMASSVRPAPIRPAKPTISPRRTWKFDPFATRRDASCGCWTVQFLTSKKTSPIFGVRSGKRLSSERPTIPRMMRSSLTPSPFTFSVSIALPSRMIVISSAICSISLSLWLMMMLAMPLDFSPTIRSSRCCESFSFRAAVGSSRMRSLTSLCRAFAISTSCCLPTPRFLICVSGSSSRPTRASRSWARSWALVQSMTPKRPGSLPRNRFSVIDSSGMSASSWWMMTMPACSDCLMSLKRTSSPS